MFGKKKQMSPVPATVGTTTPGGTTPSATKAEATAPPKAEKLPGPQEIPQLVGSHLVVAKKRDPDWVWHLKAVLRKSPKGKEAFDVRVFDEAQVAQKQVRIKDWTTLDQHPDLILYKGWFDKESRSAELEEKKGQEKTLSTAPSAAHIFTEDEIWQKLVGLEEPGSTVFFYLGASVSLGGPFGRGAAVIQLNPNYPGKNQKRYIIYTDDVDGGQPLGKRQKAFDSDKSKEIARWIKERHYKASAS